MTCDQCRWKTERHECPWDFDLDGKEWAEDCNDFRYVEFPETAFKSDDVNNVEMKGAQA